MKYVLGIDIGTSGTKTALFDETGTCVASYTGEYPLSQPANGWAEQAPADWWQATVDGIQSVLKSSHTPIGDIKGVGLSGQMHGLVLLDAQGEVLRPCIIWADQRTGAEVEDMERLIGRQTIIDITANPPMTGFTAAKILWVKKHEPKIWEKVRHILLPKDYIRYKLTGTFVSDVSDASGMQLMNVAARDWSPEILALLDISPLLLPELVESQEVSGRVHEAAAATTGLLEGTVVVGGAGDNAAAAIGTGVYRPGKAFTTIGSSAVVYTVTDAPQIDPDGRVHTLCASVPGKWTLMSCTQAAGLSLKWLRDTLCQEEVTQAKAEGVDPYEIMTRLAAAVPPGANRLLYLPYLMGERSPYLDPNARGVFFGLSAIHTKADLIRSVLEGVAFSQRQCVDVFRDNQADIDDMIITGGGGRSSLWRQMLADLYNTPVRTLQTDQGGALGAAILAGVGSGLFASIEEACEKLIHYNPAQAADTAAHDQYEPYFELYKDLYTQLSPAFDRLAAL
ncbi:MAG: xylulokinase [Clostridiaceae bacterium]|nr:xylulokinase [Clostridiaceae bacterium]